MKKLIAGNWKMNGTIAEAQVLASAVARAATPAATARCDFLVCPPALHIAAVREALALTPAVALGAQDCAAESNGAYTGDLSAAMAKDAGCDYVILGHSERRHLRGENSDLVGRKAGAALAAGLITIICVGEKEDERVRGDAFAVVRNQLAGSLPAGVTAANSVIAYEPVWAIGTGKTATPEDIRAMHGFIRAWFKENLAQAAGIRLLYGGSVKPENAGAIFAVDNVDGALIGGASLKAEQFLGIASAA